MRSSVRLTLALMLLIGLSTLVAPGPLAAQEDGVVRAVFFYSPTCPHCHLVATAVLPALRDRYGDSLLIAELDASTALGNAIWQAAVTRYEPELVGVPMMIIGEHVMIGSVQIPEELPGYIEAYLEAGGVGWPDLPGMEEAVADLEPTNNPGEEATASDPGLLATVAARFRRDLAGNILSTVVLVALVAAIVAVIRPRPWQDEVWSRYGDVAIPVAIVVGLIAATYLAFIETTGTEAICGPVGDCNTVNQSEYALLLGFLPVAVFGVLGYLAIIISYVYARWIQGFDRSRYVPGLLFLLAVFGLLFSTYLTFLEPFVIGATCAWCLTSAVSMLVISLLTAGPGWRSLRQIGRDLGLVR